MHDPWTENYRRGYEWQLMVEAKARNPAIKLYGLAWAYPQWVTCAPGTLQNCSDTTNNPYGHPEQLAMYVTKWVAGAKNTYGLDIDYIGSWVSHALLRARARARKHAHSRTHPTQTTHWLREE